MEFDKQSRETFFCFKRMHLKILLFTITSQMLLFASDTKSYRQACEKAKPLFAKMDVSEDLILMYLLLIFCVS